jgi:hypothetical protein
MALMRSHSTTRALTDCRSPTGGVIVLLSLASKPLSGADPGHRRPAMTRQRCTLTRSRRPHFEPATVHKNPDDNAEPKSP